MPQPPAQTDALQRGTSRSNAPLPSAVRLLRPRPPSTRYMAASQPAARSRPYGAPRSHAGPQETNSDPYPATSHHGSSRHRGFTLSMILTSLIRATCSARGETRVEMTHKALPPTRALGAGLHQREDAVPELAKADRVSECRSLLGGLYPAVGSPGTAPRMCSANLTLPIPGRCHSPTSS